MHNFLAFVFIILFFGSILAFVIGMIRPTILKLNSRRRVAIFCVIGLLLSFVTAFGVAKSETPEQAQLRIEKAAAEQQASDEKKAAQQQVLAEKQAIAQQSEVEKQAIPELKKEIASKCSAKVDIQSTTDSKGNNKVAIWFKNDSEYKVSGVVNVKLLDAAGNVVDSDMMRADNVEPARSRAAVTWLKTKGVTNPTATITIMEYSNP